MGSQKVKLSTLIFVLIIAIMLWVIAKEGRAEKVDATYMMVSQATAENENLVENRRVILEESDRIEIESEYNEDELYWLARIISAEAKGEPVEGQIAVGNVVLNRVEHDSFPDTIKEVIFQKNQFSPVNNGSVYHEPTELALESAERVLRGERLVGRDVLYFYNASIVSRGSWVRSRETVTVIGNHTFGR